MRLFNITELVQRILEEYPEARDDDYLLWLAVLQSIEFDFLNMPVRTFLKSAKYMKFPHYETVSRIRRKIQEHHPELRASAETQAAREELEERFREFARSDI